jgi:hypothetical protein
MPEVTVLPITSSNPDSRLLLVVIPVDPSTENGLTTNSYIGKDSGQGLTRNQNGLMCGYEIATAI